MADDLFSNALIEAKKKRYPIMPSWLYPWLIILGTWRLFMILSCVAILLVPIYKGRGSREKHLWFITRKYSCPSSRMPYLVPNRPMMVVICELLSGAMYFTLACLNYASFKSSKVFESSRVVIWYGTSLLPSYIGIWFAGWGLLYACLGPRAVSENKSTRFLKPYIFNALSFGWGFWVIIITGFWVVVNDTKISTMFSDVDKVISLLEMAVHDVSDTSKLSLLEFGTLVKEAKKSVFQLHNAIRNWAISWIAFQLILVAFHGFILFHLFGKTRKILELCQTQDSLLLNHFTSNEPFPTEKQTSVDRSTLALNEVRNELRIVALYSFSISLVLLCEVGVLGFQVVCSNHMSEGFWLALTAILCMIPSTFLSPVLLMQCWRIFSERSASEEPQFTDPLKYVPQQLQVPIFHEQLMKWYAGPRLDETEVLQFETFSGLLECPEDPPSTTLRRKSSVHGRDSSELSVEVIKIVTITNP